MTEERRKYMHSISKEEWFIRDKIDELKHEIRVNKSLLSRRSKELTGRTMCHFGVAENKVVIKLLKKQLPAPRTIKTILVGRETVQMMTCPNCGNYVRIFSDNYCPTCGQKLRE